MSQAVIKNGPKATPKRGISGEHDLFYIDENGELLLNLAVVLTPQTAAAKAHLDAMLEVGERQLGKTSISQRNDGKVVITVKTKPHWEDA